MPTFVVDSPIGALALEESDGQLVRVRWTDDVPSKHPPTTPHLGLTSEALRRYFTGEPESFDLPVSASGSDFQRRVWREMRAIPHGQTRTYGDLAHSLGSAPRAVGMACGANPIPIIVPCHRIVASNGLGGYSGGSGLETKVFLLRLEGALL